MSYRANGKVYALVTVEDDPSEMNACAGCAFDGNTKACEDAPSCFGPDTVRTRGVFKEVE